VTLNSIVKNLPQLKKYFPMMKKFWADGIFESMDKRYFRLVNRSSGIERFIKSDYLDLIGSNKSFTSFKRVFDLPSTPSYLNKMLMFDTRTLLPALLHVEDRVGMAHSIETRVPFLDYRIIEFMTKIPPNIKFKGGDLKYLLKASIGKILTDKVLSRKDKMGFPVPLNKWMKNKKMLEFVMDIFSSSKARDRGIHDNNNIEKLIMNGKQFDRKLWALLSIELWQKKFIDG